MRASDLLCAHDENPALWRGTRLGVFEDVSFSEAPASSAPFTKKDLEAFCRSKDEDWAARLVFVNGYFCAEASAFFGLAPDMFRIEGPRAYALVVPAQTCLATQPIALVCLNEGGAEAWASDFSLRLHLGENARVTLVEKHLTQKAQDAPLIARLHRDIRLEAQAKLVHAVLADHGVAAKKAFGQLLTSDAHLGFGAYYDIFDFTMGCAAFSRHAWTLHLAQEMAQARLLSGLLGGAKDQPQLCATIAHDAPNCTSRQESRAILTDSAQGRFYGKIFVAPHAQKTDGHQTARTLLLADTAKMTAEPVLEIYADDVKCSHGCTMGDLDESALFYLRSRGVPEAEARTLLLRAFMEEIVTQVPEPLLRAVIEERMKPNLSRLVERNEARSA